MPRVLEIAMQTAVARQGVAVVVIPGDIANQKATVTEPRGEILLPRSGNRPIRGGAV